MLTPERVAQIEQARQILVGNTEMLARLMTANAALADAAVNDPARFAVLMENERVSLLRRATANPDIGDDAVEMTPEVQARIEEAIRMQNVAENMSRALEEHPESFGSVHMLYVTASVHGAPIKAFVDCGAQATIMTASSAKRCGIMHLMDSRFAGTASGIGTQRILGRVHSVQLSFPDAREDGREAPLFVMASITVLEDSERAPDMLLGLDMLRRYRACVDLSHDALVIEGRLIPFLSQSDVPNLDRD